MRHNLLYKNLGLIALGLMAFAASPAAAQTVAPGPYYPPPSWDQKLPCGSLTTCPRFIVLSNWNSEAVLDRETGLVWEKSPDSGPDPSGFVWLNALGHCNTLTVGNRKGWRLPTIQELASLIDASVPFPGSLPPGHPFMNVQSSFGSFYWSATTNANNTDNAWDVNFNNGDVNNDDKTNNNFVWCVRGGA